MAPRPVVDALLEQRRFGAALVAIERLVEEVFCEPLNTAEIFGDAGLDAACQRIGAARLAETSGSGDKSSAARAGTVFIASRLQSSGGHTALLFDIAGLSEGPVTILLTGVGGPTQVDAVRAQAGEAGGIGFERAPRGDRLRKLDWLQARLRALAPATVWLFNHHQDSVAVAAVQPGQGYRLRFAHHGDHHLCLGVHLPFGEHFDPHPMGYRNCREVLGLARNRYLPMAIPDPGAAVATGGVGPLVTCTAAGSNKIEHAYWPAYAEVVAMLLERTGGVHIHVGRLSAAYRARIGRALERQGVAPAAFRYLGPVRSVALTLVQERVDLYLSSFPYAGARTLVEAMAVGVPIAAHDHSGKRFLSAMDMLPPGSCFWSQPAELLAFLADNDRSALAARGQLARRHYESYQSSAAMAQALRDTAGVDIPPTAFRHRPDFLAQAVHRSRQFSVRGLAARWLLRTGRRFRSVLS